MRPHRRQPTGLPSPWDSPGKNTGVGCHFLLQCMEVKSESEVAQSCPTLGDLMDCSLPGFSVHGIFQARVLEWGAIAFSWIPSTPHYLAYGYSTSFLHSAVFLSIPPEASFWFREDLKHRSPKVIGNNLSEPRASNFHRKAVLLHRKDRLLIIYDSIEAPTEL